MSVSVKEYSVNTGICRTPITGMFRHSLDPKKRLTIPSGWRKAMGNPEFVYAMQDRREKCVNILPTADILLEKVRNRGVFDPEVGRLLQKIGAMIEQVDLDVQGRIRLSDKLLDYAGLSGVVVMIGAFWMIKLWSASVYDAGDEDDSALDSALAELGL